MSGHRVSRRRKVVTRRWLLMGGLAAAAGAGVWWWRGAPLPGGSGPIRDSHGDLLHTVPRGELPAFAKTASAEVQEIYRYAADRGEALEYIPCFCGCAGIGHRSNRDCYVKARYADGTVTYTSHGAT